MWHRRRPTQQYPQPTTEELAELADLPNSKSGRFWTLHGRELRVTNLDKVLFPASKQHTAVTKRELIWYMARIGPWMLPYLVDRPRKFQRYPDGAGTKGFWQKAFPPHAPEWMRRWRNDEADPGETEEYLVVDEPATLAFLANWGVLEVHAWTSTIDAPHQPSWAMIDIDPGTSTTWDDTLTLARLLPHRARAFRRPRVPEGVRPAWHPDLGAGREATRSIRRGRGSRQCRGGRRGGARSRQLGMADRAPRRQGAARLHPERDQQDARHALQHAAAPGAPVSVPITWDELDDPELRSDRWTVRDRVRAARVGRRSAGGFDRPPAGPAATNLIGELA